MLSMSSHLVAQGIYWGGQLHCRCQLTSPSKRLKSMTLPLTRSLPLQLDRSVHCNDSRDTNFDILSLIRAYRSALHFCSHDTA